MSVVPLSEGDVITRNILKQASSVVDEHNRLITLMQNERVFFDEPLEALDRWTSLFHTDLTGKKKRLFS